MDGRAQTAPTDGRGARRLLPDLVLGFTGVAMGLSSLAYPFGRDQALYHYVAREWLRGSIPYRDVFDHKTPGIYLVHLVAVAVLGPNMWGIRLLDLLALTALGVLAGSAVFARGDRIPAGTRGAAVLLASCLFYGALNYWDMSQSEVWYSMLGVGAVWAARRVERDRVAFALAGAFGGALVLMKPPGVWLLLVALWQIAVRVRASPEASEKVWSRLGVALGWFAFGASAVVVPVIGYFAAEGALGQMYRIAVKANSYYLGHETGIHTAWDIVLHPLNYAFESMPFSTVALLGAPAAIASARVRGDRSAHERVVLACALAIAAFACVFMQLKFYRLHWTAMLGPTTMLLVALGLELGRLHPRIAARPAVAIATVTLVLFVLSDWRMRAWLDMNVATLSYLRGRTSRAEYATRFDLPGDFSYSDSERVGLYIRDHTTPDDPIAVRRFEPQIYVISGRRYPGRFFWTIFFTIEDRESPEQRAKWLDEDTAALAAQPPKYVVCPTSLHEGPDSSAWFAPKGYAPVLVAGELTVLARPDALGGPAN